LKKRTLTNLYNENPTWLQDAHRELDDAVFAAYGWPNDLSDQDISDPAPSAQHRTISPTDLERRL
jgi:hypothetical protein